MEEKHYLWPYANEAGQEETVVCDVLDILAVAEMVLHACLLRRSSSVPLCFERSDDSEKDPAADRVHITVFQENGQVKSRRAPSGWSIR